MADHLIPREALGSLAKLGQGGQGIVYRAPQATTQFADAMVFKEYRPHTRAMASFEALVAMTTLIEDTLSPTEGQQLASVAAWPCAVVEHDGTPVGFVMPATPDSFYVDLTTVKGVSRSTAELQHLLNRQSVLTARGFAITDGQRHQLLLEFAKALAFMHRIGICIGDISPKNALFSLDPRPAVYFIDCDAMRINGASVLPQVETPEWGVPTGEELATVYSDTYKLGLLALRLLAGDQHTKDPRQLPATTPKLLRQLISDTLRNDPARRPLPEAWIYILGNAIDHQLQQNLHTPTTHVPQIHVPEPAPVVRRREPTLPKVAGPVPPKPGPSGPGLRLRSRKRTAIVAAAFFGALVLVATVVIAQRATPAQDIATFDGTFTATYGQQTDLNGLNPVDPNGPSTSLTWVVRSTCEGSRCVATAATRDRPEGELSATFDYVDGQWSAVYTREDIDCKGKELWAAFSLAETSGGSLSGVFKFAHADGTQCNGQRSVTFTRVGDPDPSVRTPDPAQVAVRKESPAQALQGSYRSTQAYDRSGPEFVYDTSGTTLCLRNGKRCLSFIVNSKGGRNAYLFEGSTWTETKTIDGECANGRSAPMELTTTLSLPQPAQDPIRLLKGTGVTKMLSVCRGTRTFEVTLERTGA